MFGAELAVLLVDFADFVGQEKLLVEGSLLDGFIEGGQDQLDAASQAHNYQ